MNRSQTVLLKKELAFKACEKQPSPGNVCGISFVNFITLCVQAM